MDSKEKSTFHLEKLPFECGHYSQRQNAMPASLPFSLALDEDSGLVHQVMSDELRQALKEYYVAGGYGSIPLGEGEYATVQGDYMIQALLHVLKMKKRGLSAMRILEIGAAYGYVLNVLKEKGAQEVLGVEPGEEGILGSARYGVPMVRDFFPTPLLKGDRFDVVLSHCVLEHIEELLPMLNEMYQSTADYGLIFFAVPDCLPKVRIGDLAIISHQHINYLTPQSIKNLLRSAGFIDSGVMHSTSRAILFGWGTRPGGDVQPALPTQTRQAPEISLADFQQKYLQNIQAIQEMVTAYEQAGKTIGLYAADVNLIGLIQFQKQPRIFNTDVMKRGKYISDDMPAIESLQDLIEKPCDVIFIAPVDYDRQIAQSIQAIPALNQSKLISLREVYEKLGTPYSLGAGKGQEEFVMD